VLFCNRAGRLDRRLIVVSSSFKRAVMNMVVHAYDIVFYLSSWSTLSYLWSDQRRYLVALAARCSGRRLWLGSPTVPDGTRVSGVGRVALPLCAALACNGANAKGERRHMQFYFENLYVSSFYASWGETLEALWRGALMERPRALPRLAAAEETTSATSGSVPGATKDPTNRRSSGLPPSTRRRRSAGTRPRRRRRHGQT